MNYGDHPSIAPIANTLTTEEIEYQFLRGLITRAERWQLINGRKSEGTEMTKIEMYDEITGAWTAYDAHRCTGDPAECIAPSTCDSCEIPANPKCPVYVWISDPGICYFIGADCLLIDFYVRVATS